LWGPPVSSGGYHNLSIFSRQKKHSRKNLLTWSNVLSPNPRNMTHFGVLNIHPENVYFGKENILNFQAATAKEQRNCPYLAPQIEVFFPDEKTTQNWWRFGGKEVIFFQNILLLKLAGKAIVFIPCSEGPQKYGQKVRWVCSRCFGTKIHWPLVCR
jgi:hypothetical protein